MNRHLFRIQLKEPIKGEQQKTLPRARMYVVGEASSHTSFDKFVVEGDRMSLSIEASHPMRPLFDSELRTISTNIGRALGKFSGITPDTIKYER